MNPLLVPMDIWSDIGNFFNTIMQPLYYAVSWVLTTFHSLFSLFLDPASGAAWALSIVLLTVVVRTALIPLFVKQINSARNMQLIGPKVKALQDKYGHDRERLGQDRDEAPHGQREKTMERQTVITLVGCRATHRTTLGSTRSPTR